MADIRTINGKNIKDATARNDIANIKTEIGTEELTTTNQTIKGAVNEIDSQIKENTNNIDTLKANDHSHENKSILDNISQDDIDAWNAKTSGGGTTTNLTIGTVTTLAAGSNATASIEHLI